MRVFQTGRGYCSVSELVYFDYGCTSESLNPQCCETDQDLAEQPQQQQGESNAQHM
jgi:hypothetical protein